MRRFGVFLLILMPSVGFGQIIVIPSPPISDDIVNPIIPIPDPTPNTVDFEDFIAFAQAYQSQEGDPHYNPVADLNADGRVNFLDFILFAQSFGQTHPGPATKQFLDRRDDSVVDVFKYGTHGVELQAFPLVDVSERYDPYRNNLVIGSFRLDTYRFYIIDILHD